MIDTYSQEPGCSSLHSTHWRLTRSQSSYCPHREMTEMYSPRPTHSPADHSDLTALIAPSHQMMPPRVQSIEHARHTHQREIALAPEGSMNTPPRPDWVTYDILNSPPPLFTFLAFDPLPSHSLCEPCLASPRVIVFFITAVAAVITSLATATTAAATAELRGTGGAPLITGL
jgi:hypothetical protein